MEATERISAIRDELFSTRNAICLERPLLLEVFDRSAGGKRARTEHPLVRRALKLAYLFSKRRPRIFAHELVIGNMSSKRIGANYYPEGGSVNILEDVFRLEKKQAPFHLSLREKLQLLRVGLFGVVSSVGGKALLKPGRMKHFVDFFNATRYFITEEAGVSHQVGGYQEVVRYGLNRAYLAARDCLGKGTLPDGAALDADQQAFFRSVLITIDGIRAMATNLAAEAERVARGGDVSRERARELRRSAAACRRVPYLSARTFQEGLQACWLVHLALNLEDFEQGLSFGRLDQILEPLHGADVREGKLDAESATELMASFQLKCCETIPIYSERVGQFFSGNGVAQGITVGGVDSAGNDVSNELSELILEAYSWIRTREPALHVRVHDRSDERLMKKAVEVLQMGCGKPSFFGDRPIIAALEGTGMTEEHARDYAVIGCVEMASQGRTYNSSDAALFNLPICLELALNAGQRFEKRGLPWGRFGAQTPPPDQLRDFSSVVEAFRLQTRDAVNEMVRVIGWLEESYRVHRTTPVNSMITQGCIDSGRDVTWGGALYDYTSIQTAGLADVGDSLFALNRLVFEERRLTLPELVGILKRNFQGEEPLRQELQRRFPRYGNGDGAVDAMTQLAADVFSEEIRAHRNSRGGQFIPGIYSMTCHIGFGRVTGALPNGRLAGSRLSNGLSAADGADRSGPFALLRSAAALDSSQWANCCALNVKFDQGLVRGRAGGVALGALFKTYFEQGGMQLQVNILDTETLLAARADPAAHPGIVVRVAGYCAYFNELQPDAQDEIIARTVHGLG
jgi:formate C-acetyltransferase